MFIKTMIVKQTNAAQEPEKILLKVWKDISPTNGWEASKNESMRMQL
jgi:hypothetical protein